MHEKACKGCPIRGWDPAKVETDLFYYNRKKVMTGTDAGRSANLTASSSVSSALLTLFSEIL